MGLFPNVPNVPGVPAVPRNPLAVASTVDAVVLLAQDIIGLITGLTTQPWGIYRNGLPVILADNVVSLDYKQEWTVSDFPLERGAFESYDKVELPFEARIRFTTGGSRADREAFLQSIEVIAGDLNLYDVVTPERIYQSVNINHYDYARKARNGLGLLIVDIHLVQVRVGTASSFSSTQSPGAADPINGGTVQPSDVTPQRTNTVSDGVT